MQSFSVIGKFDAFHINLHNATTHVSNKASKKKKIPESCSKLTFLYLCIPLMNIFSSKYSEVLMW